MSPNYTRLRKRARLVSVVVSVLFGAGLGVAVLASLILAMKLSDQPVGFLHYIIAACVMIVSALVILAVLMPTDKRFAKRLDEEHKLNEKVRTMVAFRASDDAFAMVQRMDADEALGQIKFTPWRRKQLIPLVVVFVVAAALLVTALVIPRTTEEPPPEQTVTEFNKAFILAELSDIKNTVEKSLIADTLKTKAVAELTSLYNFVEAHEYLSEMKIEAIKSVIKIDTALDEANTALLIGEKLSESTNQKLRELGGELTDLNGTGVQKKLGELQEVLMGQSTDEIAFVADELSAMIEASGADDTSILTSLFVNLAAALSGCESSSDAALNTAFGTVKTDAMTQVMVQNINKLEIGRAVSRLCSLFSITVEELVTSGADEDIDITPPTPTPPEEDEGGDDYYESEDIGSGGIGTGDRVYGSNDMIYNPYTNTHVPYGQLLDEYNNRVLQLVEDGRIPPDFETFIKEYFRSLSAYEPEA